MRGGGDAGVPPFAPSGVLRNPHVQSILASLRRLSPDNGMAAAAQRHILDCGGGVRLLGFHSPHPEARSLVVLIHGWEGCQNSTYLRSMACTLYADRHSVFRLNLRDHGDTHALNELPFHSARIAEVLGACRAAQALEPSLPFVCIGFSLGGNFALRVGLFGPDAGVVPALSIGISPAIDPRATLEAIDRSAIYRRYFLRKWRADLRKKADAWPGRFDFSQLARHTRFVAVTRDFAPRFTEYPDYESYLAAYTLGPAQLLDAASPLAVITAQDDPVIPFSGFDGLHAAGAVTTFLAPMHGGHCGFIEDRSMRCWAEQRVGDLLRAVDV